MDQIKSTKIEIPTSASFDKDSVAPEAMIAAFKNTAHVAAKLASPAALPRKLAQPQIYDTTGEYAIGTSWPDQ